MTIDTWVQLATGPGGALVVLLLVGWAFLKYGLPYIEKRDATQREDLNRLLDSRDKDNARMMKAHDLDREVYRESITKIADGLTRTEGKLDALNVKVDVIVDDVEGLKRASGQ